LGLYSGYSGLISKELMYVLVKSVVVLLRLLRKHFILNPRGIWPLVAIDQEAVWATTGSRALM
jgi:hypothetical protein